MRKFVLAVMFLGATVALPSAASAAIITLVNYSVTPNADPGLVVNVGPNIQAPNLAMNLAVGVPSAAIPLFNIGTQEDAANNDDFAGDTVTANFTFLPAMIPSSDAGTVDTNGFFFIVPFCSNSPCDATLSWGSPVVFNFGSTGQLRVDLSDVTFPLDGDPTAGNQTVSAVFTLLAEDTVINPTTPVPEPATMLLLGTGLLAAARARRRKVS